MSQKAILPKYKKPGCPIQGRSHRAWVGDHLRSSFLILAALILFVSPVDAQQPSAHDLAQRVDRHYNQLHSLKAQFTETYEGLGRMRWDYSNPSGKLFLLDGKYAWFYSKGDPQVQRIAAKELDDLRSPLRFLLGHTQLEKEIDHLTEAPGPKGNFLLYGIPHGQGQRIQRLTLTVTAEGVITAIEIQETDGAVTHFTFTGEQTNAPVPASVFHFTPPEGVPVIDGMAPV